MDVENATAAASRQGDTDYPALFRTLLLRSVQAALANVDPAAARLDEDQRARSLYALSLALDLAEAWPAARDLTLTIAPFMETQGYRHEWIDFLEKGITLAESQADASANARLHVYIGRLYQLLGDYATADRFLGRGYQLAQAGEDRSTLILALDRLAIAAVHQHDFLKARTLAEETLAMLDPDDPACTPSLSVLGLIALRNAEWDGAIDYYTRIYELRKPAGIPRFMAQAYRDLGYAHSYAGHFVEAQAYYEMAVRMFGEQGNELEQATSRMTLGMVHWRQQQNQQALACYALSEPVLAKFDARLSLANLYNNEGLAYRDMGFYAEALQSFTLSLQIAREIGYHLDTANFLESLGGLYLRMGRPDDAVSTWQAALEELALLPETPRYLYQLILKRLHDVAATPPT
jgi:tetratricopeptide (TPR) repeat protein